MLDVPPPTTFAATAHAIGDRVAGAIYVGYSMGGRLCLRLALDRPDLVRARARERVARHRRRGGTRRARRSRRAPRRQRRARRCGRVPRALAGPADVRERPARRARRRRPPPAHARVPRRVPAPLGAGAMEPMWNDLAQLTMPVLLVTGTRDEKYTAIARRMLEAHASGREPRAARRRSRAAARATGRARRSDHRVRHRTRLADPQADREQRGQHQLEPDRADERGDQRRRIGTRAHEPHRCERERRGRERDQRPRMPDGARRPRRRASRPCSRRRAERARGFPTRTASVRLPATTSESTSRTLFASRMPHAGSPTARRTPPRLGRQLQVLHVRAADRRDEPEEREHHHLAETEVAVRLRAAGVGDRGDDRRDPDQQAATGSRRARARRPRSRRPRTRARRRCERQSATRARSRRGEPARAGPCRCRAHRRSSRSRS